MLCEKKIKKLCEIFECTMPNPTTELNFTNKYTFSIAVILSAQSTDKSVNKITNELFKVINVPQDTVKLGEEKLKNYIKSIGLYNNKAKNIIALSKTLIEKFNSELPLERDVLETLPGIGRKSANVIMNQICQAPFIAVDTHVKRTVNRIGITSSLSPISIENDLIKIIPAQYHKNISNWLVLHGRYICMAKKPSCDTCKIRDICEDFQKKSQGF